MHKQQKPARDERAGDAGYFFALSGLHSHNHSAFLHSSQVAVLYSNRAVTALALGLSLY